MPPLIVNQSVLRSHIQKIANSPQLIEVAFMKAQETFMGHKEEMLEEFDKHSVTVEILEGMEDPSTSSNPSNTLGGRGNLFTYIGFPRGTDPITPIRQRLMDDTDIRKTSLGAKYTRDLAIYQFPVSFPSEAELENEAPMPFQNGGRSWVRGIEKGIPGLNYYIYWKYFSDPKVSRSSYGTMAKDRAGNLKAIRGDEFSPTEYMSGIKRRFIGRFKV
jgi:hypothetical protein